MIGQRGLNQGRNEKVVWVGEQGGPVGAKWEREKKGREKQECESESRVRDRGQCYTETGQGKTGRDT